MTQLMGMIVSVRSAVLGALVGAGLFTAAPAGAVNVTVDPGDYAGQWGYDVAGTTEWYSGMQAIDLDPGYNFIFVGGVSGFGINVDEYGNVTSGPSAVGGPGTLTFNTVTVNIDPGDFEHEWIISRVTAPVTGPLSLDLVPAGHQYLTFVGGGNSARFVFQVGTDGQVVLITNVDAAEGGPGVLSFNTTEVFIDPGTYTGFWQIPGVAHENPILYQIVGPASVYLVTGVSYVFLPNQEGKEFPVTEPCTTTELEFAASGGLPAFVATVGCAPNTYSCEGFFAPMDKVVTVRKNRALPLKGQLTDTNGFTVTDLDVSSPPVVEVLFTAEIGDDPVDVTDEVLPVGQSSTGNAFSYDQTAERWHFNLSTLNYSASGTYDISMESGDEDQYAIYPRCTAQFVIQ